MRVGFGYDVHRLVEGRKLVLGGVEFPHSRGLLGHSDGDVVLHAICDAILGAASSGDIGIHFPNNDSRFKDISSLALLEETHEIIKGKGFMVKNIDVTIVAEKPRVAEIIPLMKEKIAKVLKINREDINIKATTNEGLGFIGKEEGIAAFAVVLAKRIIRTFRKSKPKEE
ncbi:MAG: 2-C-methyl-D-erythritol 2,4-cyclodiphosphate synthase [Thermodesulfobacteriota bacterium]|jgi:2-C-methyl-D-erythritol 2,4-cyclodiphosphate synthase|nr:MAG: 2-C-methyl-D-erythritol 2,4-cyclodiphosphate synthase [Thermodesulfobacteriota bacterium]